MFSLLAIPPVSAATHKTGAGGKSASSSSNKSASTKGKTGKKTRTAKRSAPRQSEPAPDRYMQIQQALADKGFFTGSVNGVWGPDSVAALKQFQESQHLAVDGKIGSLSLIALGLGPKREPISQVAGKPESVP
jgi:peptidoglycan hydrolase-like protein with peptidoglycan-binding domain